MLAHIDCDNFFVSCEKVFNPKLEGKPVVVLSSNDGCVISRSKEAKALGIAMGAPAFEYQALFKKYNVALFSSNFALYLDMSRRVMQILQLFSPVVEVYSVDEAFLSFDGLSPDALEPVARKIQQTILQWIGIPVSIGIAPTKTLAKVATHYAKKQGICILDKANCQRYLEQLAVQEIWGIGRRFAERLRKKEVYTAWQFALQSDTWIKKELSVVGLRLAWELRGIPCLTLEELREPKKSISTAKAFDQILYVQDEILAILADYTASVAEKLRKQGSLASYLVVWITGPEYQQEASLVLAEPTAYTPTLIQAAKKMLQSIFKEGMGYKKLGVMLGNFTCATNYTLDFFQRFSPETQAKQTKVMQVLDIANEKWGKKTLYFACQKPRKVRKNFCSPRYTTNWDELLLICL